MTGQAGFRTLVVVIGALWLPWPTDQAALPAADKSDTPPWDGHITYDFSRDRTVEERAGAYGGKVVEEPERPVDSNSKQMRREPSCPPPTNRCQDPKCGSDADCAAPGSGCCHNGCTQTCTFLVDPPAVVDWLEERDSGPLDALRAANEVTDKQSVDGLLNGLLDGVMASDAMTVKGAALDMVATGVVATGVVSGVVTLNGCALTPKQKEHLDQLRESANIGSCFCEDAEVACHVHRKDADATLQGQGTTTPTPTPTPTPSPAPTLLRNH